MRPIILLSYAGNPVCFGIFALLAGKYGLERGDRRVVHRSGKGKVLFGVSTEGKACVVPKQLNAHRRAPLMGRTGIVVVFVTHK